MLTQHKPCLSHTSTLPSPSNQKHRQLLTLILGEHHEVNTQVSGLQSLGGEESLAQELNNYSWLKVAGN